MTNIQVAKQILTHLYHQGLNEIYLCAGSRNSPFIETLDACKNFRVLHFFEEREAAFFAYQRFREHKILGAVLTTSGTAVAECLPACIEAYYKDCPLVILSADRPKHFRGSGAPQSIEQPGIFSDYADLIDLDIKSEIDFRLTMNKPNHINVCFDEPLLDEKVESWQIEDHPHPQSFQPLQSRNTHTSENICHARFDNPLIIVGDTYDLKEQEQILGVLENVNAPILLEAKSNLRGKVGKNILLCHDLFLDDLVNRGRISSIVRLGGIPTSSFWRNLERRYQEIPVYHFSSVGFSGLSRKTPVLPLQELQINNPFTTEIIEEDAAAWQRLENLLRSHPQSEPGIFYALASFIEARDHLYLGNSLPIRQWDLFTDKKKNLSSIGSNRGANGIDGQVSSFLGFSHNQSRNIGIFGDLTFLYGLSAPWILKQLPLEQSHVFVVVNNGGGQIFRTIYTSASYLNQHSLSFSPVAELWGLDYEKVNAAVRLPDQNALIEIQPDNEETENFWKQVNQR